MRGNRTPSGVHTYNISHALLASFHQPRSPASDTGTCTNPRSESHFLASSLCFLLRRNILLTSCELLQCTGHTWVAPPLIPPPYKAWAVGCPDGPAGSFQCRPVQHVYDIHDNTRLRSALPSLPPLHPSAPSPSSNYPGITNMRSLLRASTHNHCRNTGHDRDPPCGMLPQEEGPSYWYTWYGGQSLANEPLLLPIIYIQAKKGKASSKAHTTTPKPYMISSSVSYPSSTRYIKSY